MKITKGQISNLLLLVSLALILFTPIGIQIKVYINRLFASSPSVESVENRATLSNYQWELSSIKNDRPYNLKDEKGRVVLINFWATWCPPCIAEMPSMQELYNSYQDKITFLFVTDENAEKVNNFFDKHGYTLPVFNPVSAVPEQIKSSSLPTTFLIDKKGNIIINKKGVADWNSKEIRTLIDQLISE